MATKKASEDELLPLTQAKVKKLIIKNFRCIGSTPVEIELDEIVVLVGTNNAGKSTILRAYEIVMNGDKLDISDFPGETVDPDNLPEIELQTFIYENKPATQWLHKDDETGHEFVRERWIWSGTNIAPKRQGHRANAADWDDKVPWGAPNIAKSRRPIPHRIDAFASPDSQANEVVKIITGVLADYSKRKDDDAASSTLEQLKTQVAALQQQVFDASQEDIKAIEKSLTEIIQPIFHDYSVTLDAKHEVVPDNAFSLFKTSPVLRMGSKDGHMSAMDKQGSGARRTMIWAALKWATDRKDSPSPKAQDKASEGSPEAEPSEEPKATAEITRPHVLLMDEPEICLHPSAIRDACKVMYNLAGESKSWQVIVTTHSPLFIDVSRDNTTIVRVERGTDSTIAGTTVFRPARVGLSDDDRELLKMLNIWDPFLAEFFFGGRTILVEGDTEYAVFRCLIDQEPDRYRGVHVVRARGKYLLIPLMKILNHFGSGYAVLHDSDTEFRSDGKANSAWAANSQIKAIVDLCPDPSRVRLVASVPNFEAAYLGSEATSEKPYAAVQAILENPEALKNVQLLLDSLIDSTKPLPTGALAWGTLDDIK